VLDDLVPADHVCRVIDAFVEGLAMAELGFERAQAAETGRPGYDPRDLLKLYLYGYLHQLRSSRRLEAECRRNVELMCCWPSVSGPQVDRRVPAHAPRSGDAAGAELVRLARSVGLVRASGSPSTAPSSAPWPARAVCANARRWRSIWTVVSRPTKKRSVIDPSAVQAALDKLRQHAEPEARPMRMAGGFAPAYNVQTAVDAEHALIVAHAVTLDAADNRQLERWRRQHAWELARLRWSTSWPTRATPTASRPAAARPPG